MHKQCQILDWGSMSYFGGIRLNYVSKSYPNLMSCNYVQRWMSFNKMLQQYLFFPLLLLDVCSMIFVSFAVAGCLQYFSFLCSCWMLAVWFFFPLQLLDACSMIFLSFAVDLCSMIFLSFAVVGCLQCDFSFLCSCWMFAVWFFSFSWWMFAVWFFFLCSCWMFAVFFFPLQLLDVCSMIFVFFWFTCNLLLCIFHWALLALFEVLMLLVNMMIFSAIHRWLMYSSSINIPYVDQSRFQNTHSRQTMNCWCCHVGLLFLFWRISSLL